MYYKEPSYDECDHIALLVVLHSNEHCFRLDSQLQWQLCSLLKRIEFLNEVFAILRRI